MVVIHNYDLRICVNCARQLSIENFYQKGSRFDSRCKACVSKCKKTRYAMKKKRPIIDAVKIGGFKVWESSLTATRREFIAELESFLMEEFCNEKRLV